MKMFNDFFFAAAAAFRVFSAYNFSTFVLVWHLRRIIIKKKREKNEIKSACLQKQEKKLFLF